MPMIHLTFFCVTWAIDEPLSISCSLSVRQLLRCFLNQSSRCPLLSRKRRRALRSWQRPRPPLSSRLKQLSSLRAVGASGGATARRQRDPSCFLSSLILTPNVVKLRIEPSPIIQQWKLTSAFASDTEQLQSDSHLRHLRDRPH